MMVANNTSNFNVNTTNTTNTTATTATTTTPQSGSTLHVGDAAILMTSCIIGVIANFFVTYLILTVRRLKTVTNVFVFSICLCNVLVSAILLPMRVFNKDELSFIPYNIAYKFINILTILIYICNLTAVSYDRLLSITQPMVYQLKQTRKRATIIVVVMWIIPLFYSLLPFSWFFTFIKGDDKSAIAHKVYLVTTLVVFMLGPLFFIIYVYVRVCIEMKKMDTFKMKVMTPVTKNVFKRRKRKSSTLNILRNLPSKIIRQMKDGEKRERSATDSDRSERFNSMDSADSGSTSCNSSSVTQVGTQRLDPRKLTETSAITDERLEPLMEHVDNDKEELKCLTNPDESKKSPQTQSSSHRSSGKVSTVSFGANLGSFTEDDNGSHRTSKNSSARNSIFSNISSSLSPLNRKRQSSISRMKHKAQELKASFAFLIVAITYMFTWLPVVALNFDEVLERHACPESLVTASLYAIAINALTDPFLYGLLLPNFRKTLKIMLGRMRGKMSGI